MEYMTVVKAAKIIHKSPDTIYSWIRSGKLPAFRMHKGRGFRIREDDLHKFMEENFRYEPKQRVEKLVEAEK